MKARSILATAAMLACSAAYADYDGKMGAYMKQAKDAETTYGKK